MSERKEDGAWFAPKLYGLGAGLPIAWQGWALLAVFIAMITGASLLIQYSLAAYLFVVTTLSALFLIIVARTTRGGWRWRWGNRD